MHAVLPGLAEAAIPMTPPDSAFHRDIAITVVCSKGAAQRGPRGYG
jgi:hypothetical protein